MKLVDNETLKAIATYVAKVAPGFDFLVLIGSDKEAQPHIQVVSSLPHDIQPLMAASYLHAAKGPADETGEFGLYKSH